MPRLLPILLIPLFLGGCALPVHFQIASLALDGFLYLTTEKSLTDHGISQVTGKDCALHRVVTRENNVICDDQAVDDTAVALAPSKDNQIETFAWQNDQGAPVSVLAPKVDEAKPEAVEMTEVVDLWSNEVPEHLLPDNYLEVVAQAEDNFVVPEIPAQVDVSGPASAQTVASEAVVDFWSADVPDHLLEKVEQPEQQAEASFGEINHIY